jgi:hypothetical protein
VASELDFNSRAFSPIYVSHFGASTMGNLAPKLNHINIVNGLYAVAAQGYRFSGKYQILFGILLGGPSGYRRRTTWRLLEGNYP